MTIFLNVTFLLCGSPNSSLAQQSNLELFVSVTDSLLEHVIDEVSEKVQTRLKLRALKPKTENDWFLESRLFKIFEKKTSASYFLELQEDSVAIHGKLDSASVFEYKILNIGTQYLPDSRMSSQSLKRITRIHFYLRVIQEPSGEILWSGEPTAQKSGFVNKDNLETLEHQNIIFTKGNVSELPEPEKNGKVLQTLLISVITGTVVYLLYALRSQ